MPCGVFNFNFYKKNITTPKTILAFQGVSHFSNKCSSTVYRRSALDLVGGTKKFQGGEGRIYHGWCHDFGRCSGSTGANFIFSGEFYSLFWKIAWFSGFDLTFQKWFVSLLTKLTAKLILNVVYHSWAAKKVFHSRLLKTILNSVFLPFCLTENHQICILCQKTIIKKELY